MEHHNLRFRPELFAAEELRFFTDVAQRTSRVGVRFKKVYYYRLNNSNSATTKYDVRQGTGAAKVLEGIERDLIIRTPLVVGAAKHHLWFNHFWTIIHMVGTRSIRENYGLLQSSSKYMRTHILDALRGATMTKKVKYILAALFPVTAARVKNYISERRLKSDIRNYLSNTPPPPTP